VKITKNPTFLLGPGVLKTLDIIFKTHPIFRVDTRQPWPSRGPRVACGSPIVFEISLFSSKIDYRSLKRIQILALKNDEPIWIGYGCTRSSGTDFTPIFLVLAHPLN
jgi:hypothetical protein